MVVETLDEAADSPLGYAVGGVSPTLRIDGNADGCQDAIAHLQGCQGVFLRKDGTRIHCRRACDSGHRMVT